MITDEKTWIAGIAALAGFVAFLVRWILSSQKDLVNIHKAALESVVSNQADINKKLVASMRSHDRQTKEAHEKSSEVLQKISNSCNSVCNVLMKQFDEYANNNHNGAEK